MILPASYLNGFAPRDGQPLYPSLWKGCVGAWNPGLGPSGLTLRDQSGFKKNGTLTNGPTFAASQGKYAINFDGVDDFVITPSMSGLKSISLWLTCSATTSNRRVFSINGNAWSIYSGPNALLLRSIYNNNDINLGATLTGLNVWHHLCVTCDGVTIAMYLNGKQTGSAAATPASIDGNPINIGTLGGLQYWFGLVDDFRSYNIILSAGVIQLLATRRGIAYEMALRRRSSVQVTTNRRRRIIIGGNR